MNRSTDKDSELDASYYYKPEWLKDAQSQSAHARCIELLSQVRQRGLISSYLALTVNEWFATYAEERIVLDKLREFATRRGIGLGRLFGSNKNHFAWFPSRSLIISKHEQWLEVLPCELEGGYVEPEDFLVALLEGTAWTLGSHRRGKESSVHEQIVRHLAAHPETLEPGLSFAGRDVFVSGEIERGYLDLLFRDSDGRFLIVEVKVKASELDKATGQLRRHRRLFAEMNHVDPVRVRLALACLDIPTTRKAEFEEAAISCFPVSLSLRESARSGTL